MLNDARMEEILNGLEQLDEEDVGPNRACRYAELLSAVAKEFGLEGEPAYAAIREWVAARDGEIENLGEIVLSPQLSGGVGHG